MHYLLLQTDVALLGLSLPEPFIVLIIGVGLVTFAGIARRAFIKAPAAASAPTPPNINIHTSQVGEERT